MATSKKAPKAVAAAKTKDKAAATLERAVAKMGNSSALQIEKIGDFEITPALGEAIPKGFAQIEAVVIHHGSFSELPKSLSLLPKLKRLILKDCPAMTEIPDWICGELITLSITRCPLRELPSSLPKITWLSLEAVDLKDLSRVTTYSTLEKLDLDELSIKQLPTDLGVLKELKEIHVAACPGLTQLPDSICELPKLKTLEVFDTGLRKVPANIGQLPALDRLVLGTDGSNKLTSIPDSICDAPKLRLLWLGENQITALPERIGNLKKLQLFCVRKNKLTSLPESVFELHRFCLQGDFHFEGNPIPPALVKEYKARIKALKPPPK